MRLPGYVDLEVLSMNSLNTLKDEPVKIAATACKLKPAEEHHVMNYMALKASAEQEIFINIRQMIDTFMAIS